MTRSAVTGSTVTSSVVTSSGSREQSAAGASWVSFGRLMRSEWVKFRSVRGWVVGMIIAGLLILLVGVFAAGNSNIGCPNGTGRACTPKIPLGPGGYAVSDSYYLVRQPLTGNGTITVRVTSLTGLHTVANQAPAAGQSPLANMTRGLGPWSKGGIILTGSTRPGSAYAAMMVTGSHGVRMQYNYTHDTAGLPGAVTAASPRWLRLARNGDTITGYDSADGTHWSLVGTAEITGLPGTVQAGMFATSPIYTVTTPFFGGSSNEGGPSQATAVFDNVGLRGHWAARRWTGDNIGSGAASPGTGFGYFHQAGSSLTVSGSGDIAPIVPGPGAPGPVATFEEPLAGVFAGLIAVVVVAAVFFTAEYRRGLIRTTLAASPQRGRVLAAKALVIGLVAFVIGLVASVIAIGIGLPRQRNQGMIVLPVSLLTEVRVIAGTAALIAVAAVLAVAIGAIMRRSAAAVTTVIVGIVMPFLLSLTVLPASVAIWVLRLTPAAGFAIQQSIPNYPQVTSSYSPAIGSYPLPPWAGFAVLCLYAAAALGLATFLLRRRDA